MATSKSTSNPPDEQQEDPRIKRIAKTLGRANVALRACRAIARVIISDHFRESDLDFGPTLDVDIPHDLLDGCFMLAEFMGEEITNLALDEKYREFRIWHDPGKAALRVEQWEKDVTS